MRYRELTDLKADDLASVSFLDVGCGIGQRVYKENDRNAVGIDVGFDATLLRTFAKESINGVKFMDKKSIAVPVYGGKWSKLIDKKFSSPQKVPNLMAKKLIRGRFLDFLEKMPRENALRALSLDYPEPEMLEPRTVLSETASKLSRVLSVGSTVTLGHNHAFFERYIGEMEINGFRVEEDPMSLLELVNAGKVKVKSLTHSQLNVLGGEILGVGDARTKPKSLKMIKV